MDYQNATNTLRRLALQLQGIQDAADFIEQAGSLETAKKEAIAARDRATAERDAALVAQAKANADLQAALAAADQARDAAHAEAAEVLAKAEADAAAIVAAAQARASEVIDAAARDANTVHAQQLVREDMLKGELLRLEAEVDDLRRQREAAEAGVLEASERLAKLQLAIAKIAGAAVN